MLNLKTFGLAASCIVAGFTAGFLLGKRTLKKMIGGESVKLLLEEGKEPIEIKFENK